MANPIIRVLHIIVFAEEFRSCIQYSLMVIQTLVSEKIDFLHSDDRNHLNKSDGPA